MKKEYNFWVYIITNMDKTTLYTGVTNNIVRRLIEHYDNAGTSKSFAGRYHCSNLVYYENYKYIWNAIAREKEIKNLSREQKEVLISGFNPDWIFLNEEVCGYWPPESVKRLTGPLNGDWKGLEPPL